MPNFAANLTTLFNEVPMLERFERAADAGFEAVEILFPYEFDTSDFIKLFKCNIWGESLFFCYYSYCIFDFVSSIKPK